MASKGLTGAFFGCVARKGLTDAIFVSVAGKGVTGLFGRGEMWVGCRNAYRKRRADHERIVSWIEDIVNKYY